MDFDPSKLAALNSATKYPSIETYHVLGDRGGLTEEIGPFADMERGRVVMTEKVDGTNGRIVLLPNGDYFIGSREELLYAKGDRIHNPALSIVSTLKSVAGRITDWAGHHDTEHVRIFYFEVYGHKIGAAAKNYTQDGYTGARLFDIAFVDPELLDKSPEEISSWREHNGQRWATESTLVRAASALDLPLVPRLGTVDADALPTTVEGMHDWLTQALPQTQVAMGGDAPGKAEGIVFRSETRRWIAKARFQDYERTLKRRK